ncbi:hypothetical protein P8625_03250 [Tenacibaculum tangerinum]|uniref:Glutathionylspermidine synthase pre-ATP-grasp-like domain-containing protein n=1 Tax=Tenacibaculum tangerinum TaxID=3038772 RepID=A0ABY8L442_9FLAO|nr:hypothetical protein [Tenacibaculum tangerinum]WGH76197.1 hypothetical protein P8625_03250 [Tenacibaculum tangerinum]
MLEKVLNKQASEYEVVETGIDSTEYKQFLKQSLSELNHNFEAFKSSAVVVSKAQFKELKKLNKLLNYALQQIVANYFKDARIREIYNLDTQLEAILKEVASLPYKIGMYRPDIILDTEGQTKICEVGCRYPINGWMLSYYLNKVMEKTQVLAEANKQPFKALLEFIPTLAKEFNKEHPIFYLHHKEKGTEAYLLFKELEKLGYIIQNSFPEELELKDNEVVVGEHPAKQFVIEMDREELKNIPLELLKKITQCKTCINDIRSIILVHDKQVLSVLYNEELMLSYMSAEEYSFLRKYLIPSYTLHSKEIRNSLKNTKKNWILKRTSGGRGIDMYVKNECAPTTWNSLLENDWKNYMVQEYIAQKEIQLEEEVINVVGMLLNYNDTLLGLGIYRGSEKSIINVHSGAYMLPSLLK